MDCKSEHALLSRWVFTDVRVRSRVLSGVPGVESEENVKQFPTFPVERGCILAA